MTSTSAVIVLHSARPDSDRAYVVNVAQMSYWAENRPFGGSVLWVAGNESILVREAPDTITALFLGVERVSLTDKGRAVLAEVS